MKTLFTPAKLKSKSNVKELEIAQDLPKDIAIAYSIQYQEIAEEVKKLLSKRYNITKFFQILGCSNPEISKSTKAVLVISDGKFHAISLAIKTKIPVYIFEDNKLKELSDKEIKDTERKHKGAFLRFLNSNRVGILVSIKPGQEKLKSALALKKGLKNKKSYLFVGNNIEVHEFENFPDIQSWINTACPRLDMDVRLVNADKLQGYH